MNFDKLNPYLDKLDPHSEHHFDPARIADPAFFAENRLDPHSDHRWFLTAD